MRGFDSHAVYGDKAAALALSGIALWDVISSCERSGSLDKDIRDAEPNPILGYLEGRPGIGRIALNGGKAASSFRALVAPELGREALDIGKAVQWRPAAMPGRSLLVCRLPSSSPIPTRDYRKAEDKAKLWGLFLA